MSTLISYNWKTGADYITDDDIPKIVNYLQNDQLSVVSGGVMARFEKKMAAFADTQYAVAFNSGTSSILAALWAVGVEEGDEVLMCDYGFVGVVTTCIALKATIVPCDIDADTLTISISSIASGISAKTKAIIVHNPWGTPADYEAIRNITSLPLVCDAAHAHGALYHGAPVSKWSDITCYSMGPNKLISGGELGCAVTDNVMYRDRMLLYGHINRVPVDLKVLDWQGGTVGLKLRPNALGMVIALAQLGRYPEKLANLISTCQRLEALFVKYGFIAQKTPDNSKRVYWKIIFKVNDDLADAIPQIENALREAGVPIEKNHYLPLLQDQEIFNWPGYQKYISKKETPIANATIPKLITMPAPVFLPEEVFENIETALKSLIENRRC